MGIKGYYYKGYYTRTNMGYPLGRDAEKKIILLKIIILKMKSPLLNSLNSSHPFFFYFNIIDRDIKA